MPLLSHNRKEKRKLKLLDGTRSYKQNKHYCRPPERSKSVLKMQELLPKPKRSKRFCRL